jgi:hypothetical protein
VGVVNEKWQVEWVPITSIKLDPQNRNQHPPEQIEHLSRLMSHFGWVGNPIVVSTLSGLCKAGEGRYLSAKKAGISEVPVHYKSFASEEDEYAWGNSDNGIGEYSSVDRKKVAEDILMFGPDFDIKLLGLKDFVIDPADKFSEMDINPPERADPSDNTSASQCPNCGHILK